MYALQKGGNGDKSGWKKLLLGEGKAYKSAAVFMEAKILELDRLPRALGGDEPHAFKTAVCCQARPLFSLRCAVTFQSFCRADPGAAGV